MRFDCQLVIMITIMIMTLTGEILVVIVGGGGGFGFCLFICLLAGLVSWSFLFVWGSCLFVVDFSQPAHCTRG